jgi:hypothetical protein
MEGCAGSEKARRVVLGAGELRNGSDGAHAEWMMGSALEHEPSGLDMILDMILDMVRRRVRTAWSERLCARGAR